ncbi:MAG: hypothetical protein ABI434_21245 [Burkholderiaceae bacterium]
MTTCSPSIPAETRRVGVAQASRRIALVLLLAAAALACAVPLGLWWQGMPQALVDAQASVASMRAGARVGTLLLLAAGYALALAVPFVPGLELGLLIMIAFGPVGAAVAYGATLLGLSLSYAAGQLLPASAIGRSRYCAGLLAQHAQHNGHVLAWLTAGPMTQRGSPRWLAQLGKHRYLALAVGLNLPGNAVVGGGGGIALLCGLSRQFIYRRFLLTIAIAVAPLPLLVLLGLCVPDIGRTAAPLVDGWWQSLLAG